MLALQKPYSEKNKMNIKNTYQAVRDIDYKGLVRKAPGILRQHAIESTAALVCTNPVYSLLEKAVLHMDDETSLGARLGATMITYFGLGSLFSRGRDLTKKLLHITDESPEKIQGIHDSAYIVALSTVMAPLLYGFSSGWNVHDVLFGTLNAMGIAIPNGYLIGWGIDYARDFTGIKKSNRIWQRASNLPLKVKKVAATALVIGMLGLQYSIYHFTPDTYENNQPNEQDIETVVQQ